MADRLKKELSKFIISNMVSVAGSKQDLLNSPCKNLENLLRKTNIPRSFMSPQNGPLALGVSPRPQSLVATCKHSMGSDRTSDQLSAKCVPGERIRWDFMNKETKQPMGGKIYPPHQLSGKQLILSGLDKRARSRG